MMWVPTAIILAALVVWALLVLLYDYGEAKDAIENLTKVDPEKRD